MNILHNVVIPRRTLQRWFVGLLLIKLGWLAVFTLLRNPEWKESLQVGVIALKTGDSNTYYKPLEYLINTGTYHGACRMPGLLPVYLPLRFFLSEVNAQQGIILLQFLLESISCILLGILGARIYNSARAFQFVVILSCICTFVTIRNLFLLSDSFCIVALIFSTYFLSEYFITKNKSHLLYAGIFIAWAVFLRQISLLVLPILFLLLAIHWWKSRNQMIRSVFIFMLPLLLAITAWTVRNRITYGRTIILVPPLEECMHDYTPESAAIRVLIITLGEDFQPWVNGGGANWFFQQPLNSAVSSPFGEKHFTSAMGAPELEQLRLDYRQLLNDSLKGPERDSLEKSVIHRAYAYSESFKSEHPIQYTVGNRITFARNFLFPTRIDDLPLPKQSSMNILQKAIKIWSMLSLWLVNSLAIFFFIYSLIKKRWPHVLWSLLPFLMVLFLIYFGYIEQRYLATSFPFFLLIIGGSLTQFQFLRPRSALGGTDN